MSKRGRGHLPAYPEAPSARELRADLHPRHCWTAGHLLIPERNPAPVSGHPSRCLPPAPRGHASTARLQIRLFQHFPSRKWTTWENARFYPHSSRFQALVSPSRWSALLRMTTTCHWPTRALQPVSGFGCWEARCQECPRAEPSFPLRGADQTGTCLVPLFAFPGNRRPCVSRAHQLRAMSMPTVMLAISHSVFRGHGDACGTRVFTQKSWTCGLLQHTF